MSSPTIKERKLKLNKISNDLNNKLIKWIGNATFYMKDYIDNGENLKIKPIDLSIKNKQIVFFAILPFSSYAYIEAMNIISSCKEINE